MHEGASADVVKNLSNYNFYVYFVYFLRNIKVFLTDTKSFSRATERFSIVEHVIETIFLVL